MDYEKKYIKYKMKYLNLLGGNKNFFTKKNNGGDNSGNYSNQCMWISILDFLNGVFEYNFNLGDIRRIASSNDTRINREREEFNTDKHYQGLLNVINHFNLQIHLYNSFRTMSTDLEISNKPDWIIGDDFAPNVVSIVSFGSHFELITSIGSKKLYNGKIVSTDTFTPNRELAMGKSIDKKLDDFQLKELDFLLDMSTTLNSVNINMEQDIEKNKTELKNLEISFLNNQKNEDYKDIQFSIVSSFKEYKNILETTIEKLQIELDLNKINLNSIQAEMLKIF